MKKSKLVVYTSICMNYMPKALVLAKSLKDTNKDAKFIVVLLEREIPKEVTEDMYKYIDEIILAKDLGYDDFDKFIFKHSIVEASTSVKGQALVHLLENYGEKVLYIDPDIKVYKKLDKISNILDTESIILTPHLTLPEQNKIDIDNNELAALQHGIYNLGFVAVRDSSEGIEFAKWWRDRLHLYCYDDIPRGIFTDQRWCDLAPAYFDVHILKDLGHNMAPWNLSTRHLSMVKNKMVVNKKDELVFFHFSGFDSGANEAVFNYYVKDKNALEFKIREEYVKEMLEFEQEKLGKYVWSYSNYTSGEKISNDIRRAYRNINYNQYIGVNPFELSNKKLQKMLGLNKKQDSKLIKNLKRIKHKLFR